MNLKRSPVPLEIFTGNLRLRRYRLGDDAALFEAARASVNEVYPFLSWCHPDYTLTEAREWLAQVASAWFEGTYNFAILDRKSGQFLGGAGLNGIDQHPVANLGYWVRSDATRRGVASEATIGLAGFGFTHLGLQRIEIIMATTNTASRRVAEKAGAHLEGNLRQRLLLSSGPTDAFCFSLLPGEVP